MSERTVHLRDIAEKAGVSRMTVSLALRDDPRVAKSTRVLVRELAKELGFKPDPKVANAMSVLAKGQHVSSGERLAFLTSDASEDGWRQWSHHVECYEGARERALEYGYELEPFWLRQPGMSAEKMSRMLWARGINGVMIAPLGDDVLLNGQRTFEFDWNRFSVVELAETMDSPRFDCARHDHLDGMFSALHALETLGYRRIGLCMASVLDIRTRHRWYSAYLLWKTARGVAQELPVLFYEKFDRSQVIGWVKENRLQAVITTLNTLHLELREAGLNIPDNLGVAVLDRPSDDSGILSGIHQNAFAIGAAAADLLVGLVRRGERGIPAIPTQKICGASWAEGKTARRIGKALEEHSLYDSILSRG